MRSSAVRRERASERYVRSSPSRSRRRSSARPPSVTGSADVGVALDELERARSSSTVSRARCSPPSSSVSSSAPAARSVGGRPAPASLEQARERATCAWSCALEDSGTRSYARQRAARSPQASAAAREPERRGRVAGSVRETISYQRGGRRRLPASSARDAERELRRELAGHRAVDDLEARRCGRSGSVAARARRRRGTSATRHSHGGHGLELVEQPSAARDPRPSISAARGRSSHLDGALRRLAQQRRASRRDRAAASVAR